MAPSLHELIGLSIQVSDPLWKTDRHIHLLTLTDSVSGYSHRNSAWLGFDSETISFEVDVFQAQEWLDIGLGRHIEVYDEGESIIHEGFVDVVEISIGGDTMRVGPLMDLCNRVLALYAPVDYSTNPPTIGDRTPTTIAQDTDSQDKYGIIEKVLSVGQVTDSEAEQARDTYLAEYKGSETSNEINVSGSEMAHVTLNVLGYGHLLDNYYYNQTAVSSSVTFTAKIEAVLADEPNALLSTDYSNIDTNAFLSAAYENDYPKASTVIKEIVAKGDVNDDRWLFQIRQGRKVYYYAQPSTIKYLRSVINNTFKLFNGEDVHPWKIRAGEWVQNIDFFPGKEAYIAELRDDPRNQFIETVTFTAPYELSIEGGKVDRIPQLLAKLGMGGVAA